MPEKMKSQKKARTTKTSKGLNGGGGRVRNLTHVQKVLLGGGMLANRPRLGLKGRR